MGAVTASTPGADPPTGGSDLIVDDNVAACESLREVLDSLGYEVLVVASARAALDAWPSLLPEIALIDIGLPEISGYELAQRLQALPGGGASPWLR